MILNIYEKGGSQNGYPPFLIRKTLSKKLYITKMIPPHTMTATCWVLGSAMRGTFSASEIVAKDKRPSRERVSICCEFGMFQTYT